MHELSIARALIDLVRLHLPEGALLRSVCVRIGPLQGVDPDSMRFAWQAVTVGGPLQGSELSLTYTPWDLHCRVCGRCWRSDSWSESCLCGSTDVDPAGTDELTLISLEVDDDVLGSAAYPNHQTMMN